MSMHLLLEELISKKMSEKMRCLMMDEGKSYATIGSVKEKFTVNGVDLYKFYSRKIYQDIFERIIYCLQQSKPEIFGIGEPELILKEIFAFTQLEGNYQSLTYEEFEKFTLNDCFMLVGDVSGEKVLRLDLFRKIKNDNEFLGGFLHGFKHFVKNGVPLTAFYNKKEKQELPVDFTEKVIEAFYCGNHTFDRNVNGKGDAYKINYEFDDGVKFEVIVYYQLSCGVYFLDTFFRKDSIS